MRRWIVMLTASVLLLMMPSVCRAGSEIALTAEDGMRRAEVRIDGVLLVRLVIGEIVPVWREETTSSTVWLSPCFDGGMLKLIVR